MMRRRGDWIACLLLSAAWIATAAWLGIDGEFPVSDDWAYAHTVRVLHETGRFERLEWTWVPMLTNAGVGWLFSSLFGFSFESLRLSSLFMGWAGMLGAFALCRQLGAATLWSALAAAVYAWSPLHLPLSFTFMTDVTFAALTNGSLVCLARGLPSLDWRWLGGGALFAAAASFSRQPGMGLFLAAIFVVLVSRASLVGWLAFLGAGLALFLLALAPERVRGALELNWYLRSIVGEPQTALHNLFRAAPVVMFTLGLLLAPFAVAQPLRRPRAVALVAAGACAAALVAGLAKLGRGIPPGIDWLFDFGIGTGAHLEVGAFPRMPVAAAWTVAAVAGVAAGLALTQITRTLVLRSRGPDRTSLWLVALYPAIYLGALGIRSPFFDRYLIVVLAPALALLTCALPERPSWRRLAVVALAVLPVACFSLGATHDWRARERARSQLLAALLAEGISPIRIDGGTPFNATHNYGPVRFPKEVGRPFMVDDEYRVSFRPRIEGYRLLRERSYPTLMPPRTDAAARVFHREAAAAADAAQAP